MLETKNGDVSGDDQAQSAETFLRRDAVVALTGLPISTIYWLISRGEFPRSVRISPRLAAWRESEIVAWQREKIAARDALNPKNKEAAAHAA